MVVLNCDKTGHKIICAYFTHVPSFVQFTVFRSGVCFVNAESHWLVLSREKKSNKTPEELRSSYTIYIVIEKNDNLKCIRCNQIMLFFFHEKLMPPFLNSTRKENEIL